MNAIVSTYLEIVNKLLCYYYSLIITILEIYLGFCLTIKMIMKDVRHVSWLSTYDYNISK